MSYSVVLFVKPLPLQHDSSFSPIASVSKIPFFNYRSFALCPHVRVQRKRLGRQQQPLASQGKRNSRDGSSRQNLSTDEILSSFEASIDDMEKDLERSVGSDSKSPGEHRRQEHQRKQQRAQEDHLRRLDILTSLPANLIVEHVQDKCSGCGAALQSATASRPGYLPPHILEEQQLLAPSDPGQDQEQSPVCQRCFRLTHYGALDPQLRVLTKKAAAVASRVSKAHTPEQPSSELSPSRFRKCLERLQSINAVVVYLVDIFDFHGSFIPALRDIIGARNPVILAVNKIDLLPPDYKHDRVLAWIQHECRALRLHNVDATHFISSVRGTGVNSLLADALRLARKRRADIYIVGAANAGKSSFINQLIRRKKPIRGGRIQTAQIHIADDDSKEDEFQQLEDPNNSDIGEENDDIAEIGELSEAYTKDMNFFTRTRTDGKDNQKKRAKASKENETLTTSVIPGTTLDVVKIPLGSDVNLYDTPGLMVSHQLTNLLDEKDLRAVVPSKAVEKVSFRLNEGKALYIGGMARIELAKGRPFFFTCFFSANVKVHPGKADDAEAFTKRHVGKMLTPPSTQEGFERLGDWTSKFCTVNGDGWKRSCIDIVLSGLGWVSVTGAGSAQVRVWVPRNVGVFTRDPLMPYEIRQGVSSYTGGRAINRRQVKQKRKQKAEDDDNYFQQTFRQF